MMREIDITGQKFGKLTALARVGTKFYGKVRAPIWEFRCDCGNTKHFIKGSVMHGSARTCGQCKSSEKGFIAQKRKLPNPSYVYKLYKSGKTYRDIAEMYSCTRQAVHDALKTHGYLT